MVFGGAASKSATACEVLNGESVELFALHNGHVSQGGTDGLSEAGATSEAQSVRTLHKHDLPCKQGTYLLVV